MDNYPKVPNTSRFKSHPNLSDEINSNIAQSEIEGGVFLKDIPDGQEVDIETQNRHYTLVKKNGKVFLWGHPVYCALSTEVYLNGSTWGGSMLKVGFIGRGMCLEFVLPSGGGVLTTSKIKNIKYV